MTTYTESYISASHQRNSYSKKAHNEKQAQQNMSGQLLVSSLQQLFFLSQDTPLRTAWTQTLVCWKTFKYQHIRHNHNTESCCSLKEIIKKPRKWKHDQMFGLELACFICKPYLWFQKKEIECWFRQELVIGMGNLLSICSLPIL